MEADTELFQFYEGFQEALKHVLPPTLGFRGLSIRNLEIVLECDSGDFMIDGASGGLSTLIDLAWQIYMFNTEERDSFTVLVDEVENHLHPTMQRRVLSDLLEAFPSARFIVSTHSPLIVNSVRDCAVYVLRYTTENQVVSELLDFENRAATASQVLDEALGVSTTIPVWADPVALLKSPRMGALLKRLESEYHMVLVDTPPMVSLADGAVVAAQVGGSVMAVNKSTTRLDAVVLALGNLEKAGANMLGFIWNGVASGSPGRYSRYQKHCRKQAESGRSAQLVSGSST